MRTYIYIDGFNFYYGAVRGTPFKWLDFKAFFTCILKSHHQILSIKYFTAMVSATPQDPDKPIRQESYIRAIESYIPEMEVYYGHFLSHEISAPLANPSGGKRFENVIKTEEKGSDVNLAVHLLNDAWLNRMIAPWWCPMIVISLKPCALSKSIMVKKCLGLSPPVTVKLQSNFKNTLISFAKCAVEHWRKHNCQAPFPAPRSTNHRDGNLRLLSISDPSRSL